MATTPTGRNVNDYLGRVPKSTGTGPRNLSKNPAAALRQVRPARAKQSRAQNPRVRPALANAGFGSPPGGGAGGIPKATTPMAGAPSRTINKPKTAKLGGRPGGRLGRPRADFPPQI